MVQRAAFATASASGQAEAAARALIDDLRRGLGGASPAVVWVFASTAQPLGSVTAAVTEAFPGATVLGASTAGEFTESGDAKSSVAAAALAGDYRAFAGMSTGLAASAEEAVARALAGLPPSVEGYPYATGILLLDPLAGRGEEASLLVATSLPDGVRLVGGAAGDDLQMKQAFVSLGARAASDAIVVCTLHSKVPLGIGVAHAHEPFSRPLVATRASGSMVHELDGRPAWDVWREVTRERAKARGFDVDALPASDEGRYLLLFEGALAIGSAGTTELHKIRAPLSRTPEGALSFACGIEQGATLRVSESIAERQVGAALEAARSAASQLSGPPLGAVVFDCICRNIILGDDFAVAVRGMSKELSGAPLAGFETYGEIALDVGDMSGFHNTTTVVLAFPSGG